MLTGGFRTRAEVDTALASGVCVVVGVGRPLAVRPDLAGRFVRGETDVLDRPAPRLGGPAPVAAHARSRRGHRLAPDPARSHRGTASRRCCACRRCVAGLDYTVVDGVQALLGRRARMKLAA